MKKRVLAAGLMLCLALPFVFTGCGSNGNRAYSDYDLSEYVKVAEYKGLERSEINVSVTDAEVKDRIQANLEAKAEKTEKKKGTVKEGDNVNIDYKGMLDGKEFQGGTAENQFLEIGSGSFIDGFEDGLIGASIGDTTKLNLTFPKDYQSKELQGKDVVFHVTINYVQEKKTPEYTDKWVAANSDVKTKKEYEASMKKELKKEKEDQEIINQKNDLWQKVLDDSEVKKFPEKEVEEYVAQIEDTYDQVAKDAGVELKDLWKQYGIKSQEEYDAQNKTAAQTYVKQQMVLFYVAEKEDLNYTKEQEEALRAEIEKTGYSEESFKEAMGQSIDDYVEMALTYEAVSEFVYKNSKVKESNKNPGKDDQQQMQDAEDARGGDNATSNDQAGGADA